MRWRRTAVQVASVFLLNPYFSYFSSRVIYQGEAKYLCAPGLNCYACPLAAFSCPIGGLQLAFARLSLKTREFAAGLGVLLYAVGFVGLLGAVLGRIPCGWICPFGFLQDLLHKVPSPKWKLPRSVDFGKYAALFILAVALPFFTAQSWFSRLCPAGALEGGAFLKAVPPAAPLPETGWFFWLKIGILVFFLTWAVFSRRPFCRAACPLGAMLGVMNRVSLYRMAVDDAGCDSCGRCSKVCPMGIEVHDNPNSPECIRCLECREACTRGAITAGFRRPAEGERTGRRKREARELPVA
jgi:ferredoxin-type protein NapH